jgi:hypothetical protein
MTAIEGRSAGSDQAICTLKMPCFEQSVDIDPWQSLCRWIAEVRRAHETPESGEIIGALLLKS